MNFTIMRFDSIASTNDEALRQARSGAVEGLCIIAKHQTAGRGRYGRVWVSSKDAGLYFSIIFRPDIESKYIPAMTLMAGVAVHDALQYFGLEPDIKWVNDILIGEKKIAGILAEAVETSGGLAVVIGIGVNVSSSGLSGELAAASTSLAAEKIESVSIADLERSVTNFLGYFYDILCGKNGPHRIIEEWQKRSTYFSGKNVRIVVEDEVLTGITDGLEPNGALRLRRGDGRLVVIQAGDVERLRADV